MNKILTIGIVTYNNYPFDKILFTKLINEVEQTAHLKNNVEFLVYDDCSTKKSAVRNNSLFKVYESSINSQGPSRGRNYIIENASGKYIQFIDGDDIFLGSLADLVSEIRTKEADVLVSNVQKVLNDSKIGESPFVMSKELFSGQVDKQDFAKYAVHQTGIWSMYKREFLIKNKIRYREDIRYEDNFFMSELYINNAEIDILQHEYYGWRMNYKSFSHSVDNIEHRLKVYSEILDLVEKNIENKNAPFLLISIWNQTYGNLIRNYPKLSLKDSKKAFKEYEKITKSKEIRGFHVKSGFKIGKYFRHIGRRYNSYAILYVLKVFYYLMSTSGTKTKVAINTFKNILPTKNKYFFTSHYGEFSDNSKYQYLEMKNDPKYMKVKLRFAVKNEKLYKENSDFINYNNKLLFYYHFYTSKRVYFNTWQSPLLKKKKNQSFIQLWHGKPYKKIYRDIPTFEALNDAATIKNKELAISRWDYCYSVDQSNTQIFKRLFPNSTIVEAEYPKTKWLMKNKENEVLKNKLLKKYNLDESESYTLYAPTYRLYEMKINMDDVIKMASKGNKVLVHFHPLSTYCISEENKNNYTIMEEVDDIQELILLMDELITDFSSIQYDFKKLDKQVKYYQFDKENYIITSGVY